MFGLMRREAPPRRELGLDLLELCIGLFEQAVDADGAAAHGVQAQGAEALAALSLDAVRGCAVRINGLFEQANAEFEEIKSKLAPGRSFSTH